MKLPVLVKVRLYEKSSGGKLKTAPDDLNSVPLKFPPPISVGAGGAPGPPGRGDPPGLAPGEPVGLVVGDATAPVTVGLGSAVAVVAGRGEPVAAGDGPPPVSPPSPGGGMGIPGPPAGASAFSLRWKVPSGALVRRG